jgi:hypothetical protein
MPIHDWTQVPSGLFHHFHQDWTIAIARALNHGRLPTGMSALVERRSGPMEVDVLTVESFKSRRKPPAKRGGPLLTLERPSARIVRRTTKEIYPSRANRIVVKHHLGRTVAVIEIVSPGNKDTRAALREFVEKTIDYLRAGIHVLIVDLSRRRRAIRSASTRRSGTRSRKSRSPFLKARTESLSPIGWGRSASLTWRPSALAKSCQKCPRS